MSAIVLNLCNIGNLIAALAIVWGLVLLAWYVMRIPIGYVGRAHKAEHRVSELEEEVETLNKDLKSAYRTIERGLYYV